MIIDENRTVLQEQYQVQPKLAFQESFDNNLMGLSESLQKATSHPRFSKVQYGLQKFITVVHLETDDFQMKEWQRKKAQLASLSQKKYGQKESLLLLPRQEDLKVVRDGFCSEKCRLLFKVEGVWETTMLQEIKNRQSINRYFSEQQLWFILLQLVQSILPLHDLSPRCIFGNLHPRNILLSPQGSMLLISQYSLPHQRDNFTVYKSSGMTHSYISPQLIGFTTNTTYKQHPNYPSCVDRQKSQSYSLGLLLLQLCTLTPDLTPYYNPFHANINYQHPNVQRQASSKHNYVNRVNLQFYRQKVHFVESRYSRILTMVVKCLLEDLPENRLSVKELWQVLLEEKRRYVMAMDGKWYAEALETIDEWEGCDNGEEGKRGNGDDIDLENMEMIDHREDPYIAEWERSLEKYDLNLDSSREKQPVSSNLTNLTSTTNNQRVKFTYW